MNRWYVVVAKGHFGYPQPEDTWDAETYGGDYCLRCGVGGLQRQPFRVRTEPKAAHSHFLQLNGVFDEFFVTPAVADVLRAEGIKGIEFESMLLHRSGEPVVSRLQLHVPTTLPAAVDVEGLQIVTCRPGNEESHIPSVPGRLRYPPDYPYCGRVKYHPTSTLRVRAASMKDASDVVKTREWFGSGGVGYRPILVSQRVADLVQRSEWRGIILRPVDIRGAAPSTSAV